MAKEIKFGAEARAALVLEIISEIRLEKRLFL